MNSLTITCPSCGKPVAIEQALSHELIENIRAQEALKAKKREKELIELNNEENNKELQLEIERRKRIEQRALEAEQREKKLLLVSEETKEKEKNMELLLARAKQEGIESASKKKDDEKNIELEKKNLEIREIQLKNEQLQKSIEELKQKSVQGSQQLQGEVQELDLQEKLTSAFPTDLVEEVEKGIRGADIRQTVRTGKGTVCGIILWESKRTKAWSEDWISKLKEDLRNSKGNIPVIVSSIFPKGISGAFTIREGVFIVDHLYAIPLAELLRSKLIDVARERYLAKDRGTKADAIFNYLTSFEFKQEIEAILEEYRNLVDQVREERAAFEKRWKAREISASTILKSAARIVGSLQEHSGNSLPSVTGLELPSGE